MENLLEGPVKVEVMWYDEPQLIILYDTFNIESHLCVDNPVILIPKSIYPDQITYDNYVKFLESRLPDKTREDIFEIIHKYGLKDFMPVKMSRKSHGRSMTDFLWLRFDDEDLHYSDITIRDNNIPLSNDYGMEGLGNQVKFWMKLETGDFLVKINSKNREATKERDASIILRACGIDSVAYKDIQVRIHGKERNACICKSFLADDEFTVTLGRLLEGVHIPQNDSAKSFFLKSIDTVNQKLNIPKDQLYHYFMTIVTVDYLLMNPDRHLSNIEFMCNKGVWKPTPLFDFGQSFLKRDGIMSMKQFEIEARSFKTLPFSRNPEKNLVDIEYAKNILRYMITNLQSSTGTYGIDGIDSLNINDFHKRIFKSQAKKLHSL